MTKENLQKGNIIMLSPDKKEIKHQDAIKDVNFPSSSTSLSLERIRSISSSKSLQEAIGDNLGRMAFSKKPDTSEDTDTDVRILKKPRLETSSQDKDSFGEQDTFTLTIFEHIGQEELQHIRGISKELHSRIGGFDPQQQQSDKKWRCYTANQQISSIINLYNNLLQMESVPEQDKRLLLRTQWSHLTKEGVLETVIPSIVTEKQNLLNTEQLNSQQLERSINQFKAQAETSLSLQFWELARV